MRIRTWAIGLFLVIGLGLFTGILFLIGDRQKAFSRHLDYYAEFTDLGGLSNGSKVRVSGLDAGKLKHIAIPKDSAGKFRLDLQVQDKVQGMIRRDSVVTIETEGVVGDKYISIRKGTAAAGELSAGSTLPSKEPLDLGALMEQGAGLLKDVHGSINDIRGRADTALDSVTKTVNHADDLIVHVQPSIQRLAGDSSRITGKIDALVTDLNAGKGPAGLLLKDETTRQQITNTLSNVQQTSDHLNQATVRANQVITDLQSRDLIAKTDATLDNVQSISADLNATLKQALAEDSIGQDGATNLRQTLSNLNRSTANLAEDTEALKHNFFLRGFFKKRGFYSLDQLTPAEYTKAYERQKEPGTRIWLQASDLLGNDGDGGEKLTANGRETIDNQVAPTLDTLGGHLIVVEGYAAAGSADQQFTRSRLRADLVRHYLETHFHLRHSNIGIVAMRDKPPEGADRNTWDGAAIMILRSQQ